MKTNRTDCMMGTMAFPSLGLVFLAAASLLLLPGPAAGEEKLNVPPEGFTALFNGKDFTGWQMTTRALEAWFVEDGMLRSLGGFGDFSADLISEGKYRDFVFLADYRMQTTSDSGIGFRGWPSGVPREAGVRIGEQVNLGSGWMGHPMMFHYLPENTKVTEDQHPKVKHISPEIGVWHTIKLTLIGKTLSIEVDGEVILDEFEYPEGTLNLEPGIISLQKHKMWEYDGKMSNCPIEYRNVFIKEIKPSD